jgi:hypothetical protein
MDPTHALFLASTVQQLGAAAIGLAIAWMGFRLFREMPALREGEAKIGLPGGVSIYFSRIGPGAFFVLFGSGLIAYTMAHRPLAYVEGPGTRSANGLLDSSVPGQGAANEAATYQPHPGTVHTLALLSAENDTTQHDDKMGRSMALREARVQIMLAGWDKAWGNRNDFQRWIADGMPQPPPASVSRAVAVFNGQ